MIKKEIYVKIKKVAEEIGKMFEPEKIILFGSYAWGKPGSDSDVDLFIVKETQNTRETARKISRLIFPRPFPMDIIVYRPEQLIEAEGKDFFIRDILQKGMILYGK